MAVDLSQITFPDYITGIRDVTDNYFRGGYDLQTQHNGWTSKVLINEILSFTGIVTIQEDGSYSSGWVTYFTLPNGYKLQFNIGQELNYYIYISSRMVDDNDVVVPYSSSTIPGFQYAASSNYLPGYDFLNWSIFKYDVYLTTHYYPDVDPIPGSTNHGLSFYACFGNPVDVSNPYNLHEGTVYGNEVHAIYGANIHGWSSFDAFDTYMHSHGQVYTGDIFTTEDIPEGPAGEDDTSVPGGGHGTYDDTSDPIDFPDLPQNGALDSGAIHAHRVANTTLLAILSKLWDTSVIALWSKSIQDPMDAIVSLHALPLVPTLGDPDEIWLGNLDMEVTSNVITNQYKEIDCGTLQVKEYWGSALDYSPYTKIEVYLPFIGVKELKTEDVMNSTLHIKYYVDVLTGDCVAFIKCGISVLYHYKGNCRMDIPLSAVSSDIVQKLVGFAGGAATAAGICMSGGFTLAATALGTGAGLSSAANVASSKISVSRGSDLRGNAGIMDDFTPYIIIHRPVQSLAKNYNTFKGYPSNITATLGNLRGYTEVEHINLQNIPNATSAEMDEIKSLLQGGVII